MCTGRYIVCAFAFEIVKGVLDQTGPRTTGKVHRNGVVDTALPLMVGTSDRSTAVALTVRP